MTTDQLHALNPRLVPLIAHDRAGFGGGLCCCGVTLFFSLWCGCPSRSLWQAVFTAGLVGFGSAIGIHPAIGYTSLTHLTPAYLGAALFLTGIVLTYQPARWSSRHQTGTDERR
jgi:MFS family permease